MEMSAGFYDVSTFGEMSDRLVGEAITGQSFQSTKIEAFSETSAHEEQFVGHLGCVERHGVDETVSVRLDPGEPLFRVSFGLGGGAGCAEVEASVGPGANAGVGPVAPVDEVVAAFLSGTRVVGNFVGGVTGSGAHLLRRFEQFCCKTFTGD